MEVVEAVIKRSMKIYSLMFGKMFGKFDHSSNEQHATNGEKMLCIVG